MLVLDECTASVDHETDALIQVFLFCSIFWFYCILMLFLQETVRTQLVDTTVICIAHRLRTIAYYDLIMVMDQGSVAEFAHPYELMCAEGGIFRELCVASGDFDELLNMAKNAYEVNNATV